MNCSHVQEALALETDSPELRAHLAACADCANVAAVLERNRERLSLALDEAIDDEALAAVRQRVLLEVAGRSRRSPVWYWAAAALFAAMFLGASLLWRLRIPPPPAPVVARIEAPRPAAQPVIAPVDHRTRRRPGKKTEPVIVKLVTEDPNVVILWVLETSPNTKGDTE